MSRTCNGNIVNTIIGTFYRCLMGGKLIPITKPPTRCLYCNREVIITPGTEVDAKIIIKKYAVMDFNGCEITEELPILQGDITK